MIDSSKYCIINFIKILLLLQIKSFYGVTTKRHCIPLVLRPSDMPSGSPTHIYFILKRVPYIKRLGHISGSFKFLHSIVIILRPCSTGRVSQGQQKM
jgi:hypothetical protein